MSWVFLGAIVAVLFINIGTDNEVNAAPEPCAFWNHHHYHYQETTAAPAPSTEAPKENEDKEKSDKKETRKERFKKLEKLIGNWMSWGQSWEMREPQNSSYVESFIRSYLEILAYLFNII